MEELGLFDQIANVIRRTFNCDGVTIDRETTAFEIDGWDSLGHTMLILELESEFALRMPTSRMLFLNTVGDLEQLIEETLTQIAEKSTT
ncbi:MAG: acyl carrier protein [bacterium]